MSAWTYSDTNEANLMKIKYGKLIEKQFNMDNVLFDRMAKKQDFVGSQLDMPVVQSIGGGVSAGTLGTSSQNKISKASLTTKKLYAVVSIDRETMKAAKTDEGSFVRMTKFPVKIATQSFNRNLERMITRAPVNNSGIIVSGHNSNSNVTGAGTSGSPYIVAFNTAAAYDLAHIESLEVGDLVNVDSETTALEVVDIVVNNSTPGTVAFNLKLVGTSSTLASLVSGPGPFAAANHLYIQNSKDNELAGLEGILAATSGSYKGIAIGRRWKSYQKDAAGAAISTDILNDAVINMKRQCGKAPTIILAPYHQYVKLLNLFEDQKTYNLPAKSKDIKGQVSFSAIEYISPDGLIPVLPSRFVSDDVILCLNDNHMELHCRPGGFEWFDDDGTVFLRESGDSYQARYGGYCDFFVNPHFQGIISGLQL